VSTTAVGVSPGLGSVEGEEANNDESVVTVSLALFCMVVELLLGWGGNGMVVCACLEEVGGKKRVEAGGG